MIIVKVLKVKECTDGTSRVTADMETGARVHFVSSDGVPVAGQKLQIDPQVLQTRSTSMSAERCFRGRENQHPFGGVVSSGREW